MSRAFDNIEASAKAEGRLSLPMRPIGPIAPSNGQVLLYALDSEESSITQPEEEFSARAREIDREYIRMNSGYALSVLPSSQPEDLFILDRIYEADLPLIGWMREVYRPLSIEFSERIHFAEPKNFSAVVSDLLVAAPEVCAVSTICYSHNLGRRFPCADEIAASGYLNSKTTLGNLSRKHSFVIPESLITTVGELGSVAKTKFRFPDEPVYMKVDGLASANHAG
ncbi:hypothetical protein AB0E01_44790 [Nocardia vinacea]|uniref:hypothetical protein n=1 Tax=Nocardia vinacea TaxID=96468 RepID=UPI00340CD77F